MAKKRYKNFTITPREGSAWLSVFKDRELLGYVPDEETARQLIWAGTGKKKYITNDMMEIIEND